MSKVLFYTSEVAEKVSEFMLSIQGDQDKSRQFITFDQMAARTKVTLESSASEVVSSIVTFASLINDVNIFIPWMNLIRGELKTYIETNEIADVTYQIIASSEGDIPTTLSGEVENTRILIPNDAAITYELFNPRMNTVLYVMKMSAVGEILSNITENSQISFTGLDNIKTACNIGENEQIGIAIPQLQVGHWSEMIGMLESLTKNSPVNAVYLELGENEETDFFMDTILNMIDKESTAVIKGERNFEITERAPEEKEEEIPTVEAEVVPDGLGGISD